jgi:hypothetical protein
MGPTFVFLLSSDNYGQTVLVIISGSVGGPLKEICDAIEAVVYFWRERWGQIWLGPESP